MANHEVEQTVVQYGIRTPTSSTILVLTESRAEAERTLDMLGQGILIERTVKYGGWRTIETDLPATG
jgi:hypothetical protein